MSAYLQDLPLASADKVAGGWVGSGFEAQPPQVLSPEVRSPQSISGTERGTLAGRRSRDCFTGVRQVELLGCRSQTETQMWTVPNACPVAAMASTLLSFPGRTVRGQNPEEPSSWPDTAEEAQGRLVCLGPCRGAGLQLGTQPHSRVGSQPVRKLQGSFC